MVSRWDGLPYVKRIDCGRVVKFKVYSDRSCGPGVKYLPKEGTVTDSNGDVVELEEGRRWFIDRDGCIRATRPPSAVKGDNLQSLKRSFARLRDLINCNATDPERVLFVTFTYDPKKLKTDLDLRKVGIDMAASFKRMRSTGHVFEYIYTVEQQGNGNWHTHCLFFFDSPAPYLEQSYLEWVWQCGFVKVSKRFDGSDVANVGAYVCADLTYGEGKDEHGRVKNERLLSYQSGSHLYRCSRGVKRPDEVEVDYKDYEHEKRQLGEPLYRASKVVEVPGTLDGLRLYRYEHYLNVDVVL